MNYEESKEILEKVKMAKKILVNCHKNPDADSVGSALATNKVLSGMGKDVRVVCPNDIPRELNFLQFSEKIRRVDFSEFAFSDFDLFLILDTSSWDRVVGSREIPKGDIETIVIDNHATNEMFGGLNLIDLKTSSVSEMLFLIFRDWRVEIDKGLATYLLTGIVGDTGSFQFEVYKNSFRIAAELSDKGADLGVIAQELFHARPLSLLHAWGEIIRRFKLDGEGNFVWSAMRFEDYLRLGKPVGARGWAATLFARSVEGTRFGVIMVEEEKDLLSLSFRSRGAFDVSKIAKSLGGGGHPGASGAKIEGMNFEEAKEKVLTIAREFAKKNE